MAENIAGMRVEGTTVAGGAIGAARHRTRMPRVGGIGLVAAALVVLLTAGVVIHHRGASHPSAPVVSRTITGQQARFLESNTTSLPNAVTADIRPAAVTTAQQRFIEVNTTMLPNAIAMDVASPVVTIEQRKFLEVNTTSLSGGPSNYSEEVTPTIGHPR